MSTDDAWAICRRVDTGGGLHRVDKAGADYWLYRLDGSLATQTSVRESSTLPQVERAEPVTLDHVYRAMLGTLPLDLSHRQALRQRGLPDREIVRRLYRTLPLAGRATLARRLVAQYGAERCAQVPGFYLAQRDNRHWWSLAGAVGLLIPVRNVDGRIVALKVRTDHPGEGPKYTTISSAPHAGPGSGALVHVPLHAGHYGDTIRVTEGELKADVATVLSDLLTVSMPGVASWRQIPPVLQALQPRRALLAEPSKCEAE